jgi:hypothetical protein
MFILQLICYSFQLHSIQLDNLYYIDADNLIYM